MADQLDGQWTSFVINRMTKGVKPDGKFNLQVVSGQFKGGDHDGKTLSCPNNSATKIKLVEDSSKHEYDGEIKGTVFGAVKVIVGTFVVPDDKERLAGQQDGIWIATQP